MYHSRSIASRFSLMLLFILLNAAAFSQYCASSFSTGASANCDDEYISRVQLTNLNNPSGVNCSYGNYTGLTAATVAPGSTYPITITVTNTFSATDYVWVWIDWNQDNTFDNTAGSNERFNLGTIAGTGVKVFNGNIVVPAGAIAGNTRMRVTVKYQANPTPCETGSPYGEVEDYTVNVCAAANGIVLNSDQSICGGSTTNLSITGSIGGKTYQWQSSTNNVTFTNIGGQTGSTYNPSPVADIYYRLAITSGGCTAYTNTILISVVTKPVVDAGPPQTICEGNSANLNGTSSVGQTASYSQSFNTPIPDNNTAWTSKTFAVAGLYPATMNDASFVSIASVCINLSHTWNSDLQIQLVSPGGTAINLANNNGGAGAGFTNVCFKTAAVATINVTATTAFNGDYRPRQAFNLFDGDAVNGNWVIRIRDAVGGSTGNWTFASITFNTGTTYAWSPAGTLSNANILNPVATPAATTDYTLKVANGSCSTSDVVKITVQPKPNTSIISGTADLCKGTSSAYSVINTPGNNYTWSVSGGGGVSGGQGSNNAAINWTAAGTWQVRVIETGTNGCPDSQVSKSVTVYNPPTISAGRDTTLCTNEDVLLGGTPTASGGSSNFNYLWSPATELSATNTANPIATPAANRSYTLTVTDVTSNCVSVDNINISMVTPVTASAGANKTICERSSVTIGDTPTAANGSANYSYNWIPATNISSTSVANPSVSPTVTTVYTVTVTDNISGCTDVSNVTVNVNPAPTGSITSNTPQCDGFEADFVLTANANDGNTLSYAWTDNNGWTSTIEDPKRNDPFPAMNRAHEVVLTNDITGCTSVLISHTFVQVDRPIAPTLTANKLTFCPGEDLILTNNQKRNLPVDPVFDYYFGGPNGWTSAVNDSKGTITATRNLTGADGGDYWLVIQAGDQSVCMSDTVFITITVFDPSSFTATNNGPICVGENLTLSVTNGGGGTIYAWSGPNAYTDGNRNAARNGVIATDAGIYSVNIDNGTCDAFNVTTIVTIDSPRNPGANNTVGICETETNFDLTTGLGGAPEAGGTWNDDTPSNALAIDKFDATSLGGNSYNFTYTLLTSNTCPNQSATLTVDVSNQTIAGVDNTIEICNTVTDLDLFALLGVTAETGGVWTNVAAAGTLTGNLWDATGVIAGSYDFDYTTSSTDCPDATATITVTVIEELNAGVNTSFEVCEDGAIVILFNELNGGPDAGGAWTDLSGTTGFSVNQFDPTAGDGPGSYDFKYTVTSPSCAPKSATLTVNVRRLPIAGNDGAETICNTENAFDLFTALGTPYDAGGAWNNVSGQGSLTGNTWDATGVAAGNYTFTYTVSEVTSTCSPDIATVIITVVEELNAGVNTSFEVCEDGSIVILFNELNGGPDAGGAWTDLSGTTGFSVNQFDPTAGDAPGSYDFKYTVTSPSCAPKSATLTVNVRRLPIAGNDGAETICNTENAFDLFTALGTPYDAGGAWNNVSGQGSLTGNTWDATGVAAGNYTFTYTVSEVTSTCSPDIATVIITVVEELNAGVNTSFEVCEDGAIVILFNELNGGPDAGGTWTDLSGTTGFSVNQFDPTAGDGPGSYDFEYTVTSPTCAPKTATLTVAVKRLPVAGVDGAATICSSENAFDLFTVLGTPYDAGGSWNNVSGQGSLTGNTWDATGVAAGNYTFTYTVSEASGACANDVATVTITVTADPNPGINTTYQVCETEGVFTLYSKLNGSPDGGGIWSDLSTTVGFDGTQFNTTAGDGPGSYVFEYTISVPNCPTNSAQLTVESHRMPIAGTDATATICNTASAFDLFTVLGAPYDGGGSWNNDDAAGVLTGNSWNANGVAAGDYDFTYTVSEVTGNCADDMATITITVVEELNAGNNTSTDICENDGIVVFAGKLTGSPNTGGSWADLSATSGFNVNEFDPTSGDGDGTYNFEYTVTSPTCAPKSATLTIVSHRAPIAGTDATATICNTASAFDLFTVLGAPYDAGGSWNNDDATGVLTGNSWNANGVAAGDYDFTYKVTEATGNCADDMATITITVVEELDAGNNANFEVCEDGAEFDLYPKLGGTGDLGGDWADLSGTVGFNVNKFDPNAGDSFGSYDFEYTVTSPTCAPKSATLNVLVRRLPVAGNDASATICNTENAFDLFTVLGSPFDLGGLWFNVSGLGSLTGSSWDATGVAAGSYNFTYTISESTGTCSDDVATITITVVEELNAGTNTPFDICEDGAIVTLIDEMNGGPDLTGTWADLSATSGFNVDKFNPTTGDGPGSYNFEYTVTSPTCATKSAILTINTHRLPVAGNDTTVSVCESATTFNLFDNLGGTPDINGSWNDDDAAGTLNAATGDVNPATITPGTYEFTYTMPATAFCLSTQAIVTVVVVRTPIAGDDGAISICNSSNTNIDLHAELTTLSAPIVPDAGGSWFNITDNVAVPTGLFNPNNLAAGAYVFEYTVSATSPCVEDKATLTINIENQPYAGIDGNKTTCIQETAFDLFDALSGDPDLTGGWNDLSATGALSGTNNELFDASIAGPGVYNFSYTITAITPCNNVTSFATITVTDQPDAGLNTTIEICNDRVVDLFTELTGTPDNGGVWTDKADGTGNVVNPATFDANSVAGGTYIFRYDLTADAPCTAVNSVLTIDVNEQPSAGIDGGIIVCDIDPTFNLFDQLGGNPSPDGTWTDSGTGSINDTINPANGLTDIYTYTPVIPNQCQLVTAAVDVTIHETPVVTFDYFCSTDALTYYIEFTVTSGDPGTYVNVSGSYSGNMGSASVSGAWTGNVFTSDDMPTKSTFSYSFTDKNGCGPTVVSEYIDCGCPSKAGDMDNALIEVCVGIDIIGIYDDTKQVFDDDDGLNFLLHDFNDPTFGNILDINRSGVPVFNFIPGTMNADQTYYISAVVGNVDGSGSVNLNDTCLSISSMRAPIRFNSIPSVYMGDDQDLCFGVSRDLEFTFNGGNAPYTVTYNDASTSTGLTIANNKVNKTPAITTTYTVTRVTDTKGCFLDVNVNTTLNVIPLPDITMTGDVTYCEGTNNPVLAFTDNIPGVGVSPYTITVNDPVSGNDFTFNTSDSTVVNFPATGSGTFVYTFTKVIDGSSQPCDASPNTTVTVVVNPTPNATITSGDKTICFNDSADIVLDFNIGTAPYTAVYNDGLNPDVVDAGIVNNPQVYTLAPTINTTYTFKSVTDANGCVSNLIGGSVVNFTVNQLPVFNDVIVDDIELCNNDSTNLLFDITGSGDFTVDYTINGNINQQVVDGSSSFTIKPTAVSGSNTASTYNYVVTKITDNASPYNCVSNVTEATMVTVYPNPTGKIWLTNNSICENSEAELNFEFTGVDKFNFNYQEISGAVSNETNKGRNYSTQFVPPGNITDFSYKLIDVTSVAPSGFTCYSEINAIVDLKVQLAPVVDIEGTDIMCQKDSRELTFNITRTTWPVTIELGNDVGPSVIYNNVVDGQKVSLNPMAPTNYNVLTIIDGSPQACVGNASGVFFLDVITLPSATMTTPSKICYGDTSFLKFDFNGGRNGYIINYTDADTLKTLEYTEDIHTDSISIHPEKLTNYVLINITDKSGLGCKSQDYNLKRKVNVVPLPEAKLDGNNTICEGETSELLFYFTKGVAPFSLTYTDGISEFTVDTIQRDSVVIVAPTETTTYEITGISDGSGIGCIGEVYPGTPTIIVNKKPNVVFTVDTIQECVPFTATFTNGTPDEQISEVIWAFGDQTKSTIINGSTISHPYERAGKFKASLTVISPENCKKTYSYPDSIIADVVPVVDFDFFPTQPTLLESQVNFYNQTKFADLYKWVVDGDTLGANENFNHLFPDDEERMYDVTLVATNNVKSQCTSAYTKKVLVKGQLFLHVPNTFTPNDDGKNDIFIPVMEGYDTEEYLFEIYNRGGQLLFSTNDFSKAWDGKHKGTKVASDLYIWKLAVKSKYLVEKEQLMGHVRLMR
jgi:gliding motility-associated-like protein